jgi:hypothetical protein
MVTRSKNLLLCHRQATDGYNPRQSEIRRIIATKKNPDAEMLGAVRKFVAST